MTAGRIPQEVAGSLEGDRYRRLDTTAAAEALRRLGVPSESLASSFFSTYEGPFWSERLGCEMLDVCAGSDTLETSTLTCRDLFGFPEKFVILTQYSAGQVLVLDRQMDSVYEVDFEGGDQLLVRNELGPRWNSFREFLVEYFGG